MWTVIEDVKIGSFVECSRIVGGDAINWFLCGVDIIKTAVNRSFENSDYDFMSRLETVKYSYYRSDILFIVDERAVTYIITVE